MPHSQRELQRPTPSTRRGILDLLKQKPQDAKALAAGLGISAMAVRQHLYALQEEKLVSFVEEPRPVGRPAKLWQPTEAANGFFPDAHAELTLSLIDAMGTAFGADGMDQLLAARTRQQIATYRERIPRGADLQGRLEALAAIRTEEGYMANVEQQPDGSWLLVENHCPICAAASACIGLCSSELEVFAAVLGDNVRIERTDHIVAGARRCAYEVIARG